MLTRNKVNLLANFVGRGWTSLLSVVLVPIYLRLLGLEGYGLIGFYITLQAAIGLLDFGLTTSLNRELARRSVDNTDDGDTRDLVRTLEGGYWGVGLITGIAIAATAPLIAEHWVHTSTLPEASVVSAIRLMGLVFACQWPTSFYGGGLLGLQHQVLLNAVNVTSATLKGLGAALILRYVSPTVEAFLVWQGLVSIAQTGVLALALWHRLPGRGVAPHFRVAALSGMWSFASSLALMAGLGLFLQQLDKIVLTAIVPLGVFAYYMIGTTVANATSIPPAPIGDTLFPVYARLARVNDSAEFARQYHRGCQMIASLVFSIGAVLAWYSYPLLLAWTGSRSTAGAASLVTSLLVVGAVSSVPMTSLDHLQMAYGWLVPAVRVRLLGCLLLLAALYLLIPRFGITGAAMSLIGVNSMYMLVTPPWVFRHLLPGEMRAWWVHDLGAPFLVAFSVAAICRWVSPATESRLMILFQLCVAGAITLLLTALATPTGRSIGSQMKRVLVRRFQPSTKLL
jgi:O-antigen/teichoic acid export membrane protein